MAEAEVLSIPEDAALEARLRAAAGRDALGAALIFSGPGDLPRAARFAAAAMECAAPEKPCGRCLACRKVARGIHPDVTTVSDSDHVNISVGVLRRVAADAYILPNEGRRKVYIFPDAGLLEPRYQGTLLKVLEEGPPHAAFLFCAPNSAALLPTVRSRAEEWRLSPAGEDRPVREEAASLCALLGGGDADLAAWFARLEGNRLSREDLRAILSDARDLSVRALAVCCGAEGDEAARALAARAGKSRLAAAAQTLTEGARLCGYNVGTGLLLGKVAVELGRQPR